MPDIIYHYTNLPGKLGIYDKNILWLKLTSKSRNDIEDTLYIKNIMKKIQQEYAGDNIYIKHAMRVMNSVLNPVGEDKEYDFLKNNVFMFCAFGLEDDTAGRNLYDDTTEVFRLSFGKQKLIDCFKENPIHDLCYDYCLSNNVIYSEKLQRKNILSILLKYENIYKNILKNYIDMVCILDNPNQASTPTSDISGFNPLLLLRSNKWIEERNQAGSKEFTRQNTMWVNLANEFYDIAPFIKNPEFIDEKEFRFSFYRKSKTKKYTQLNDHYCIEVKINSECLIDCNGIGFGTKAIKK